MTAFPADKSRAHLSNMFKMHNWTPPWSAYFHSMMTFMKDLCQVRKGVKKKWAMIYCVSTGWYHFTCLFLPTQMNREVVKFTTTSLMTFLDARLQKLVSHMRLCVDCCTVFLNLYLPYEVQWICIYIYHVSIISPPQEARRRRRRNQAANLCK